MLLGLSLLLAACAQQKEPPLEEQPVEVIYQKAESLLAREKFSDAAKMFEEVERLYPYSDLARRALVMSAWAHHKAREYEEARAAAQRFLDFYPADEDAPWAQYIIALSYYDQIARVGRDKGVTLKALEALRTVMERYPDSDYARSARLKFDVALDQLAAKEMEVGRYYLRHQHYGAAINRFRVVVEDFPTSTQTPEALYRLVEAYLSLGLTDEAQTAGAILGYNFRGTDWYRDAHRLLTGRGLAPEAKGDSWLRVIWRRTVRGEWI